MERRNDRRRLNIQTPDTSARRHYARPARNLNAIRTTIETSANNIPGEVDRLPYNQPRGARIIYRRARRVNVS